MPPWRAVVWPRLTQMPLRSFWISTCWPSTAGVRRPRKRIRPLRAPRSTWTLRVTLTVVPTTTTGLTTFGFEAISTRYCVLSGHAEHGNANSPRRR